VTICSLGINYSRCLDLSKGELILVYGYGIEYLRPEAPSSIIATSNVLECLSKRLADLFSLAPKDCGFIGIEMPVWPGLTFELRNVVLARIKIRNSKHQREQVCPKHCTQVVELG